MNSYRNTELKPINQCLWEIVKLSTPAIGCCFVAKFQDIINIAMVGRLDEKAMLAGVGLGTMVQSFICFMALKGLNAALDTLVS